jgi:alkaline phosphatase D
MEKKFTRRQVLKLASAVTLFPIACSRLPSAQEKKSFPINNEYFVHGIASGDPDQRSVVIWTRVSHVEGNIDVQWQLATDAAFNSIVKKGRFQTSSSRDYTVKVVVDDLIPNEKYYYQFIVNDVSSAVGKTRTLPVGHIDNLVLALATCANYPFGYFNAYDAIAKDQTIDVVVHMGDYIYEYGIDGFGGGEGKRIGRNHLPSHEILTLDDYRQRHAQYKTDLGSLAMHARHPLIVMWDDHETANNPWMGGASNHQTEEGSWQARRQASLQAYYEWLPVRDPVHEVDRQNYWRHYKFGDLASLITLESRHSGRSEQISLDKNLPNLHNKQQAQDFMQDIVGASDRNMLSADMETFLEKELKESVNAGRTWRIIGNPSVIAKSTSPQLNTPFFDQLKSQLQPKQQEKLAELIHLGQLDIPADLDMWDGYPAARERFYQIAKEAGARDLLVVSGDSHSYWANALYDADEKPMGVELGATGISSPRSLMKLGTQAMKNYDELNMAHNKEIVWADGRHRGYIRLEINHQGGHADFIAVSNVESLEYETKIIHSVDIEKNATSLKFGD